MRLTRAGLGVILGGILCFAIGRILGTFEMFILGTMCFMALFVAAIYTSTVGLDLSVSRTATPTRLRAGTPARIDLELRNRTRRSTPVLHLTDGVSGSSGARLTLAPVRAKTPSNVAYRLPTRQRGVLEVGPLDLQFGDPLGLSSARVRASDKVQLLVHPALLPLRALRTATGHDPTADQKPRRALAASGDEFFALRPYVVGDELRRVNWRASARTGDLMVRQEERPKSGRITVVLDRRRDVYEHEGFERAVSAALSALHAGWNAEDSLRFVTTHKTTITEVKSRNELDAIDEQLATLDTVDDASLGRTLEDLAMLGRGGTLVAVTGLPTDELPTAVERAKRHFGAVIVIACQMPPSAPPTWVLRHDGVSELSEAWDAAVVSQGIAR